MVALIGILGILEMLGGVAVTLGAKSAIHEILGAISFGMGVLALGLAAIIRQLADVAPIRDASDRQATILQAFSSSRNAGE